jgi:carotenoid cleavage dioxygenase-like enzyme
MCNEPNSSEMRRLALRFASSAQTEVLLQLYRQVVRFVIDTATRTVSSRDISAAHAITDFPKINPKYSGVMYCVYYANEWFHNGKEFGSMAIVKHNICSDQTT